MRPLLFILATVALFSCCKKEGNTVTKSCPIKCNASGFIPFFDTTRYGLSDIDTVIFKKYEHDGTFTTLVDYKVLGLADTVYRSGNNGPGGFIGGYTLNGTYLDDQADYEIEIVSTQQVYRIWGIKDPEQYADIGCDGRSRSRNAYMEKGQVSGGDYEFNNIQQTSWPQRFLIFKK